MIQLYTRKEKESGESYSAPHAMTKEDATTIITTFAKYPKHFVNLMMVDELELEKFDPDEVTQPQTAMSISHFAFHFPADRIPGVFPGRRGVEAGPCHDVLLLVLRRHPGRRLCDRLHLRR